MTRMNALVIGATGLIGRQLAEKLGKARALSRSPQRANLSRSVDLFGWDPTKDPPPDAAFADVDVRAAIICEF